jgi:hypothetical protein
VSAVAPAPAPASAAAPPAHAAHAAGNDRLLFAAVLDRVSGAEAKARPAAEDRAQAQSPDDGRRGEPPTTQADRPTALIESALSSLFAAPSGPPASEDTGNGGAEPWNAGAQRLAAAPAVEPGPEDEAAPRPSTTPAPHAAVGARLAGERSYLLPSAFAGAIAAPPANGVGPESRTSAPAPDPAWSGETAGGPLRMSALAPPSTKPSPLDAAGGLLRATGLDAAASEGPPGEPAAASNVPPAGDGAAGVSTGGRMPAAASAQMQPAALRRAPTAGARDPAGRRLEPAAIAAPAGVSIGGRTPAAASTQMQPDALRRAPTAGARDHAGRRLEPAAIVARGARQVAAPSPPDPSAGAGPSGGGSYNAGAVGGQASDGGLFAEAAQQPAAIGLLQAAPTPAPPHGGDAAPRPSAPPTAADATAAPVREIDLDLSPGGLEHVTMTMRLAGDRLNVVIRAASSQTAGGIEGAREAIAERLAAIGQPLGSLIIQQTGSSNGGTNTEDSGGGDDGRPQGQRGDPDDKRGDRRGASGF